jgi:ATP-dependent exoDNAse (exonuclease V) beta subunit
MVFNHVPVIVPKLEKVTMPDGKRWYATPTGERYPSVTTVLSQHSKQAIMEWRRRVGEGEANKVSRQAASRGTHMHNLFESYLRNKPVEPRSYFDKENFDAMRPILDRINNIRCLETPLYSHYLRLAGTVDCVADFDEKLAIIDFKTSLREKQKDWIKSYFMQTAGYAIMYEELTGTPVPRGVILISVDADAPQVFVVKRDNWVKDLLHYRDLYERTQC